MQGGMVEAGDERGGVLRKGGIEGRLEKGRKRNGEGREVRIAEERTKLERQRKRRKERNQWS